MILKIKKGHGLMVESYTGSRSYRQSIGKSIMLSRKRVILSDEIKFWVFGIKDRKILGRKTNKALDKEILMQSIDMGMNS